MYAGAIELLLAIALAACAVLFYLARRSERRMRARADLVFKSSVIGMTYWDAAGRIQDANEAFIEMTGYSREELMSGGVRLSSTTPPEYMVREREALLELSRFGKHR